MTTSADHGWSGLGVGLANLWRLADAETRSISPENFTGERGRGGMATEGTGVQLLLGAAVPAAGPHQPEQRERGGAAPLLPGDLLVVRRTRRRRALLRPVPTGQPAAHGRGGHHRRRRVRSRPVRRHLLRL